MVMQSGQLDLVFSALSDATRRSMLMQLSKGATNISTLAAPYSMSQPAASKHLKVLEKAGLITKEKRGREYIVRVNTQPAAEARDWIAYYTRFWQEQFDAVETYLAEAGDLKSDES